MKRRLIVALIGAAALLPLAVGTVTAHPLGNFTINHDAAIRVEPDRVSLDVVIDEAEIPAFQAARTLDADGDGRVSAAEIDSARVPTCVNVSSGLSLSVDGRPVVLRLVAAGLSLPPGSGGLPTMRVVCELDAPLEAPLAATTIQFSDAFEPSRIGWREITASGDGVTIDPPGAPTAGATARLTAYPSGLAGAPDTRTVTLHVSRGGPTLAPFVAPDAAPVGPLTIDPGGRAVPAADPQGTGRGGPSSVAALAAQSPGSNAQAAVPGGDVSIPLVLGEAPVTPGLALAALLAAILLGAGHAVTPGHGKTLVAAYLVGTRGAARHAIVLGLVVALSHTMGVLALAVVVLGAETALPPDVVVRAAPLAAALGIVGVGVWMLALEARRWRSTRRTVDDEHGHPHHHEHGDQHAAGDPHQHDDEHPHRHEHATGDGHEHGHGPLRHSHAPAHGARVTRRGLFVLGLAGGLVPSANALLILLATIASGRPAWGVALVAAFGMGMAGVLSGVGLVFVYAGALVERLATRRPARLGAFLPATTAVAVLLFGLVLTSGALATASIR